jgi:hypothetical protein
MITAAAAAAAAATATATAAVVVVVVVATVANHSQCTLFKLSGATIFQFRTISSNMSNFIAVKTSSRLSVVVVTLILLILSVV